MKDNVNNVYFTMVIDPDYPHGIISIENEYEDTLEVINNKPNKLSYVRLLRDIERLVNKQADEEFKTRLKVKIGEL